MENYKHLTKTDRAIEMLSLYEDAKYYEKALVAAKLSMSIRQVYRAWKRLLRDREDRLIFVNELEKWKSYSMFLYKFFTEKWFPDSEKEFTKKDTMFLEKIENDLKNMEEK